MELNMEHESWNRLQTEATNLIYEAMTLERIVNVPNIAERVQKRCADLNVAVEDIEAVVLHLAERNAFLMEFDGRGT
jgi:hypothetical protein